MSSANLVSLSACTELLSIDDRDEAILALLVASSSARVERYLTRQILEHNFLGEFDSLGQRDVVLSEYPVRNVTSVCCDPERVFGDDTKLADNAWYCATVPYDVFEDLPGSLIFDPFLTLPFGRRVIRVEYTAGYPLDAMPEDLKLATLELVAWELRRVKSKQIGVSGLVPTSGRMERTVLEMQMPANVREMLEPYRRRTW